MHDHCVVFLELETSAPFVLLPNNVVAMLTCSRKFIWYKLWYCPPCEGHVMEWTTRASKILKQLTPNPGLTHPKLHANFICHVVCCCHIMEYGLKVRGCYGGYFFMSSNFDLHNTMCVALVGFTMKHQHKLDWEFNLLQFNFGHQKCMFVGFLNGYTCRSTCAHYWMWSN